MNVLEDTNWVIAAFWKQKYVKYLDVANQH